MVYLNYYSKIRNVLNGNAEELIAKEKNRIVTKQIEESNWTPTQLASLIRKATALSRTIDDWREQDTRELHEHYTVFRIPKANGGYRTLHAPDDELKHYQNLVKDFLVKDCSILCHNAVHSYVKHRNCKTAIEAHKKRGARWFLKMDIKDFFDNCNLDQTIVALRSIHPINLISYEWLKHMLSICFLDDRLPQGAPSSPILSNLYLQDFDYKLTKELPTYTYTRYADDLLISSKSHFDWHVIQQKVTELLPLNLHVKREKTRYGSYNGSNWNLGLMYNNNEDITVGYKNKKLIKNKIHNLFTSEPEDKNSEEFVLWLSEVESLKGVLGYYKHIEPEYFTKLIERYKQKGYAL